MSPSWFTYTGIEVIPHGVTHVFVDEVEAVPNRAFYRHRTIVEVIFAARVKNVGKWAFDRCPSLRRVIMPGVKVVGWYAFNKCPALTDVVCGKLEIIEDGSFECCTSLMSIDLPAAEIVKEGAFENCTALTQAKFGEKLKSIKAGALSGCRSLERVTVPMKDGIIIADSIFQGCESLKYVDVEGDDICQTITMLYFEEWGNKLEEEIYSINQILHDVDAGGFRDDEGNWDMRGKAKVIGKWIKSSLRRISHYKAEHQRLLEHAAKTLQLTLPKDIVTNNVLPFLELPF